MARLSVPERGVEDWLELDRRHVWHPYGPMPATSQALPVVGATGVRLQLADGRELIDGMASWWCAIHGYRHPVLDRAAREQLDRMSHVMFGGLTHQPAVRLAERLVEMSPEGLEHVFFCDSGSVAVEVALKLCMQARPGKHRMITVRGGYHGDTFGAMAVCDPGGMHEVLRAALPQHLFAERPPREITPDYADHVRALVTRHADDVAAIIVEPVVQGAGGMWFYDPAVVRLLREVCDEYGLLLILDEIATGFGRTGALFACELADVTPDVLCVGKALTGGYVSLAATLCTPPVARSLRGSALMHGPTYMANPLACAIALASTALVADGDWRGNVARIERGLRRGLQHAHDVPGVKDVRVLGAIGVLQVDHPVDMIRATEVAVAHGVWLRPFRDLIYTMPPYVTETEDLRQITETMTAVARAA